MTGPAGPCRLPAVVGVVCGSDAAVRKDIESVAAVRFPGLPLYFEETTVSGPGASLPIVDALKAVVTRPGVDVVILARGGGDGPSLLPWSSEEGAGRSRPVRSRWSPPSAMKRTGPCVTRWLMFVAGPRRSRRRR